MSLVEVAGGAPGTLSAASGCAAQPLVTGLVLPIVGFAGLAIEDLESEEPALQRTVEQRHLA